MLKYLTETSKLKKLYIDYDDSVDINNNQMLDFVEAIKNNYSLVTLSILGFPFNDNCILKLSDALMINRRITSLKFDFLGATSYDTVVKFFQNLVQRGIKLKIKWPEELFSKIPRDNEKADEFANNFEAVNRGNHQITPPPDSVIFQSEKIKQKQINDEINEKPKEQDSYYNYYLSKGNSHSPTNYQLPNALEITNEGLPPLPENISSNPFNLDETQHQMSNESISIEQNIPSITQTLDNNANLPPTLINQFGYDPNLYGDHGFLPSIPSELIHEERENIPGLMLTGYDNQSNCDQLSSNFNMKASPKPETEQKGNKTQFKFKVSRH